MPAIDVNESIKNVAPIIQSKEGGLNLNTLFFIIGSLMIAIIAVSYSLFLTTKYLDEIIQGQDRIVQMQDTTNTLLKLLINSVEQHSNKDKHNE